MARVQDPRGMAKARGPPPWPELKGGLRGGVARRHSALCGAAWGWVAAGGEGGSGGDGRRRRRVVATEVGVAGKSRDGAGSAAGREAG